jgi:hypothetical protein
MTPTTGDLCLYVSFVEPKERGLGIRDRWQIDAWVAEVAPNNSFAYCDGQGRHAAYESLLAHAQAGEIFLRTHPDLYGWELRYSGFVACDLARTELMHATLKRLNEQMAQYAEQGGPCESYGQYVQRFGQAIGARCMAFADADQANGSVYRFCSLVDGMTAIDMAILRWHVQLLA